MSGFVTETTYNQGQAAQDAKITEAKATADKANTSIGDWDTQHPGKTIAQEVTRLNGAIPDVSGFVTETTYNQGQAAQDTKITAAQAAANKANTSIGDWETEHPDTTITQAVTDLGGDIPDVSGFVTETTYNQGQAAQDTKITAAQAAANKANTSIGDWETEHPDTTITQAVTDLGGDIPDVSGFVTETTYNQEQAAQNTKITAAQNAANKANTSIGDWDAQHPGKTIAQIDVRTYLDELYPENSVIMGTRLVDLYSQYYKVGGDLINVIQIPIIVPYIVTAFPELWTLTFDEITSVIMYNATGVAQTRTVKNYEINTTGNESVLFVNFESPFEIAAEGIYHFKLNSNSIFVSYHWNKNNIKFAIHPLPGTDT